MAVKFAFAKNPTTLKDKFICWWMRGPYFHSEVILAENADGTYTIASSVPGIGVRTATNQQLPADEYDIIEGPGDVNTAIAWFKAHDGEAYDWLGLLRFVMPPLTIWSNTKWWCTDADLAAVGMDCGSHRYDPNAMAFFLKGIASIPA
jgi:hypothetical protein